MITIKHKYTNEVILEIESLCDANLSNADLSGANLRYVELRGANLRAADLSSADLRYADLSGANLSGANLRYVDLRWCIGNMREIKSAQFDTYDVTWTKDALAIGCQQHPIKEWWQFDDTIITNMDRDALLWWKKWKLVLQQIIEMSA